MPESMIGRRIQPVPDDSLTPDGRPIYPDGRMPALEQAGDYCGPMRGYTGDVPACFFLLPNARDEGATGGVRPIHHVCFPPHTYRECPDGSLEIRASIGAMPFWHGYLDEGHSWRSC